MFQLKQSGLHTLSYGFLDDLEMKTNLTFYFDEMNELSDILNFIVDCALIDKPGENTGSKTRLENTEYHLMVRTYVNNLKSMNKYLCMHDGYFFTDEDYKGDLILNRLITNDYYVKNHWNKYYVYVYAIDFVRPEIYSKQTSIQVIDWEDPRQSESEIFKVDQVLEQADAMGYLFEQLGLIMRS